MHSRIFQISETPIDKCDYIEEDKYYDHWFTNSVADYVNGNTDRNDDIEWLKDCYENRGLSFGIDDGGEYFVIEDKLKYFAPKLEEFKSMINKLLDITIEDFASIKGDMDMYHLRMSYEEKFGFYIDSYDWGLCALDDFIRQNQNGDKFYIGATIDYHC